MLEPHMRAGAFVAFSMMPAIVRQSSRTCSFAIVSRKSSTDAVVSFVLSSAMAHFVLCTLHFLLCTLHFSDRVLLVLEADEFHQLGCRQQRDGYRDRPRLGVGLGVVDGDA